MSQTSNCRWISLEASEMALEWAHHLHFKSFLWYPVRDKLTQGNHFLRVRACHARLSFSLCCQEASGVVVQRRIEDSIWEEAAGLNLLSPLPRIDSYYRPLWALRNFRRGGAEIGPQSPLLYPPLLGCLPKRAPRCDAERCRSATADALQRS